MTNSIQFDGTEILTSAYLPQYVKHETATQRMLTTLSLTREDGSILIADRRGVKVITLKGTLIASTQDNLDAAIDAFKELFSRTEKNLDVSWNGSTRRYVATCTNHNFDRDHYNTTALPWTAEFTVLSGEGKDTGTTTPLNAHSLNTSSDAYATDSFSMLGSKPAKPTITLQGNNFDASNTCGIEYYNSDTGERLVVTRPDGGTFGTTKTIIINCDQKKVTSNLLGSSQDEIRFYGVFPTFKIGTNNVAVKVGGIVNQDNLTGVTGTGSTPIQATTTRLAQSFSVPYSDGTFQGIGLFMQFTGAPGNLTMEIQSDAGNKPSGIVTASFVVSTGGYTGAPMYFASKFALAANTKYWIVLYATGVDGSNYWSWVNSNLAAYVRGTTAVSTNSGVAYTIDNTIDYIFQILYGGVPATSAVLHTVAYKKTYL